MELHQAHVKAWEQYCLRRRIDFIYWHDGRSVETYYGAREPLRGNESRQGE